MRVGFGALRIHFGVGRFSLLIAFYCEMVRALNCAFLIMGTNLAFVFGALMVGADRYLFLLVRKRHVCLSK